MRILAVIFYLVITGSVVSAQDRLRFTDEQCDGLQCQIVDAYFEYKKYVSVITNRTETARVRNGVSIALFRLLHPDFTIDGVSGGRDHFISNLKKETNTFSLLKRSYESFDCPVVSCRPGATPSSVTILKELQKMNIVNEGETVIRTNRYRGYMLFSQTDLDSYAIGDGIKGISKEANIMRLNYVAYPITEDEYVLKIESIHDVTEEKITRLVRRSKKDSTLISRLVSVKDIGFEPCCPQPNPPDSDGDGYNDIVDCAPDDSSIYPGAVEVIGDGIDQDCDGKDKLGDDYDGDGYYVDACKSSDPEVRKKCDCNDNDKYIYYRPLGTPESQWYQPGNGWNDDNCDCIKDKEPEFNFVPLKSRDYLTAGLGHLKRGKSSFGRKVSAYGYFGLIATSASYGVYHKIKAENYYSEHLAADTFRESYDALDRARSNQRKFLVGSAIAITTFTAQYFHLKVKEGKERRYYRDAFNQEVIKPLDSKSSCTFNLTPTSSSGLGLGLYVGIN